MMHFMGNVVRFIVGKHFDFHCNDERLYTQKLVQFPWTTYHRDRSRIPKKPVKFAAWKTDECQVFAFPCGENVVDGNVLNPGHYEVFSQVSRLVEVLYHTETRSSGGWVPEHCHLLEVILVVLGSMIERHYGLSACRLNLHLGVFHLVQDIYYLGGPSNWWCYAFERMVKTYTGRKTNEKNIELTYAKVEARLDAVSYFYRRHGFDSDLNFLTSPFKRNPGYVLETVPAAHALADKLHIEVEQWNGVDTQRYRVAKHLLKRPFCVGTLGTSVRHIRHRDLEAIMLRLRVDEVAVNRWEVKCFEFQKGIFVPGHGWRGWRYRLGEHAIFKAIDEPEDVPFGHPVNTYVCKVIGIYLVRYKTTSMVFFKGAFYDDVGGGRCNPWNEQLLLTPASRTYMSDIYPYAVIPATFLVRPCMLVPMPKSTETVRMSGEPIETVILSCNDFMRPLLPDKYFSKLSTTVPVYPFLTPEGTIRLHPPQVAGQKTARGFTTWGVITRFNAAEDKVTIQEVNSVGREGRYQGTFMQREGGHVYRTWSLLDIQYIVNATTHSRKISWSL